MAREKTWQFDPNRVYAPVAQSPVDLTKYLLWYYKAFLCGQIGANFAILASTITVVTPGGGGTLAANTYFYQVTALTAGAVESPASNEVFATVGASGSVALTWTAVAGASSYRVYRGTAAGGENVFYAPGNVTNFTDTGAASTGGSPPTSYGTWVLLGSSDATTGAMDGLDRWTNTYSSGKLNRNTAGLAHSWVVLRGPVMNTQTYFILLDWSTSLDFTVNVTMGVVNIPTGGTVNNAPTVQNLAAIASAVIGINAAAVPATRIHGALATDGSFNILMSRDFSMKFSSAFLFHMLADFKVTDGFPVWMFMSGESGAQNPGNGIGGVTGALLSSFDYSVNAAARTPDNTASGACGLVLPITANIQNSMADAFDGTFIAWPVVVGQKVTNNNTLRGRLQDIYFSPYDLGVNAPNQGVVDNPSSPQYMLVGLYWFPTNAIPIIY